MNYRSSNQSIVGRLKEYCSILMHVSSIAANLIYAGKNISVEALHINVASKSQVEYIRTFCPKN